MPPTDIETVYAADDASSPIEIAASIGSDVVRFIFADGEWHIAAKDLCAALKLPMGHKNTSARHLRRVDPAERSYQTFVTRAGPQRLAAITVTGGLQLTKLRTRLVDHRVRAFIRREAARLQGLPSTSPIQATHNNAS